MKRIIRKISRLGYQKVAKPIMFKHQADNVHHGLIRTGKRVQKIPGVKHLPKLWSYQDKMLETEVAGMQFRNPVGLSAGFDKALELPALMKSVGFGWMTGGSVTFGEYEGNPKPWFYRLPNSKALVVNAGLPSEGTSVVAKRVSMYSAKLFTAFPLNVSVAKTNSKDCASDELAIADYCESLAVFDKLAQVTMLEINISCPNTFGGEPFTTPDRLKKLLQSVDKLQLKKPVFIKMPVSLPDQEFDALTEVVTKHKITGLAISNLLKDRTKVQLKDDLPATIKGNLSGAPTRDVSTHLIRQTYQKYGDKLVIIGIGGVFSAEDAYEKIRAGASLVALVTGLIYEGPQLVGDINHGLAKLLKKDGFKHISEAVGKEV